MPVKKTIPVKRTTKRTAPRAKTVKSNVSEPKVKEEFGSLVKTFFPTPTIDKFEIIELNMSGFIAKPRVHEPTERFSGLANILQAAIEGIGDPTTKDLSYKRDESRAAKLLMQKYKVENRNSLQAALDVADDPEDRPYPPSYMPMQVQTRMNLSRYFCDTEGDCWNVVAIPIELLSRKVDVQCPDKKMKRDIEDFIAYHRLEEIGGEIWRSVRKFGQAYPYEVWDESNKELIDVVPMNPLNMHVGNYWFAMTSEAYGKKEWDAELIKSVYPPAMYKSLMRHWGDNPFDPQLVKPGIAPGMLISGNVMKVISDGALRWERYSMPMLSRGFRELTTRIIYEDAIRAIVEGMKNQFWVIKLGSPDRFNPNEMNALKSTLGGQAGDRTGMLVWRDSPLTVEVHVPAGLDQMVGNDYGGSLTKAFFRKMGITSKVMSGESPGQLGATSGRGAGGTSDTDVTLYLERARYQATQITDWMAYLVKKWLISQGSKYSQKNIDKVNIVHGPTSMEMVDRVKNIFAPLYDSGALSHQTLMNSIGLDSDVELENKKSEKQARDDGLLDPPLSFSQGVINKDGSVEKTSQTKPQGSPDATGEHRNNVADNMKKVATPIKSGE